MEDFILTGEHEGNNLCIWNSGQLQAVVPQSVEKRCSGVAQTKKLLLFFDFFCCSLTFSLNSSRKSIKSIISNLVVYFYLSMILLHNN